VDKSFAALFKQELEEIESAQVIYLVNAAAVMLALIGSVSGQVENRPRPVSLHSLFHGPRMRDVQVN